MKNMICSILVIMLVLTCSCCKTTKKGVSKDQYPLVGTQWMLAALEGEDIGTDFALRPFITFDTNGNIQGNLGCNSFFGSYKVNKKQKMTLEFTGASKRLCQQMGVERHFLKVLKRDIVRYKIIGNELFLFAEEDEEVMRFTGVDLSKVE